MKNFLKSLLLFTLVFVIITSLVPMGMTKAAAKGRVQNIEMYIGEAYESTDYSQVKSIKNTNKAAVKTSKVKKIIIRLYLRLRRLVKLR